MKTILSIICLSLISILSLSQNIIHFDTLISKTINVNESFDLKFLDWPSTGYTWYLPVKCDSTKVKIQLSKKELMAGDFPKGGKWISTYTFSGLFKGRYLLEYYYGRSWLTEKINTCTINLMVK
ncbi:MAG: protease inhibitor I42 family protein [Bacteroidetes bacterium]|nr:protease inhibitor I42 family protein [Bacteroidota bacterium]